jgi:hypothetical protein
MILRGLNNGLTVAISGKKKEGERKKKEIKKGTMVSDSQGGPGVCLSIGGRSKKKRTRFKKHFISRKKNR